MALPGRFGSERLAQRRFSFRLAMGMGAGALAVAALVIACDTEDTGVSTGKGNTVAVDVPPTKQPDQPSGSDAGADSPFAPVDSGIYAAPDGYSPYATCQKCGCPATDYCFGGGTGYTAFSGNCKPTGFGIGCQPLPPACVSDASCDCLLVATASAIPCYAVCVQNTRTVYCPNP